MEDLVSTKRTVSQVYNVRKQRELSEQFLKSAYHVEPFPNIDVHRYGQKNRVTALDVAVLERMGKKLATDPRFCPPELATDSKWDQTSDDEDEYDPNVDPIPTAAGPTILGGNTSQKSNTAATTPVDEGEEEEEEPDDGDEEEEEVADYTTNYYESADEEDDYNDSGEATF